MHDIHSAGRRGFLLSSAALALAGVLGSSSGAAFAAQPPARLVITAIPDDGDADRFAHYVRKDKIAASASSGRPVVALCGKVWKPGRNPADYPVCPTCKSIYEEMRDGKDDGGNKGPRFPRFPFGRGQE